mmetsp:Transcript_24051/g.45384  ORF Transcript_24051/g.45384 Transcript_24051/m.45384 type:complete len:229 (-) Transcript_24051:83-769(-)
MELTHSNPELVPQELGLAAVAGTKLQRFLRGFQEGIFQEEVDKFVRHNASHFASVCLDGSYPLEWTNLHNEYKELFDQQLEAIFWFNDSDKDQFLQTCEWLSDACRGMPEEACIPDLFPRDPDLRGSCGLTVGSFRAFMSALTASEDFHRFLQVMFSAAAGTLRPTLRLPAGAEDVHEEIAVPVPEGAGPGSNVAVTFLGQHFALDVPAGYTSGMSFPASLPLPPPTA